MDPATREVGVAAASCTAGVDVVAALVPGRAAVASQALASFRGRDEAAERLARGRDPAAVVDAIASPGFDPARWYWPWSGWKVRQYGVAALDAEPRVAQHTGARATGWKGGVLGETAAVQGNLLRGEAVVVRSLEAFQETEGCPLEARLAAALAAGQAAGGDRRCSARLGALSAYLAVAGPGDAPGAPGLEIEVDHDKDLYVVGSLWHMLFPYDGPPATPPVDRLLERFAEARPELPGFCQPVPPLLPSRSPSPSSEKSSG